jgi:hypothetical protein
VSHTDYYKDPHIPEANTERFIFTGYEELLSDSEYPFGLRSEFDIDIRVGYTLDYFLV